MIVFAFLSVIHLLEAWLEVPVIGMKDAGLNNYSALNKQEHFRSAVLAASWMAAAFTVVIMFTKEYWILPALFVNRRVFFDYPLILFRQRPRNKYEGNDWWVNKFRWLFRGSRIAELVTTLAISIFCIVQIIK